MWRLYNSLFMIYEMWPLVYPHNSLHALLISHFIAKLLTTNTLWIMSFRLTGSHEKVTLNVSLNRLILGTLLVWNKTKSIKKCLITIINIYLFQHHGTRTNPINIDRLLGRTTQNNKTMEIDSFSWLITWYVGCEHLIVSQDVVGQDNNDQNLSPIFLAQLNAKRDEEKYIIIVELRTKDVVNGLCGED